MMRMLSRTWVCGAMMLLTGPVPVEPASVGTGAAVDAALPTTRDAYAFLHTNPELGKKEFKAHDYIVAKLKAIGFSDFASSPSLPTAVIAVLDTGRPGPVIALRAEMDARPLPDGADEPVGHAPRSAVKNVMHNCGHDVHAAILLGVAEALKRNPGLVAGRIVFLFQPAEETPGGADNIVADGTLDKLGVTRIFALHSAPGMHVGTVGLSSGDTLAGSNYFKLVLRGRSAHAAAPFESDDVALSAMRVAEDISTLPARRVDISARPMIISITSFTSQSGATNVLPASAEIDGTIRAYEDPTATPPGGQSIKDIVTARVAVLAGAYGLTPEWKEFRVASPTTHNDPALFAAVVPVLANAFPGTLDTATTRSMYSEDFAYYTAKIPALYFSLGVAKDGLGMVGVHQPGFTVHPDALRVGMMLMTMLAEIGTTGRAPPSMATAKVAE